ncbi:MAG: hypothetical protein COT55_01125 [Candidatus Diapherotrites archaeon CG09_land_8_20_14_0_10_32_12]|nr:MAG: hypothetical protein COT55_01125 [Candidatus Diapherotrites archaeon CG09_land_8_20_14_0_10_32_12]
MKQNFLIYVVTPNHKFHLFFSLTFLNIEVNFSKVCFTNLSPDCTAPKKLNFTFTSCESVKIWFQLFGLITFVETKETEKQIGKIVINRIRNNYNFPLKHII